MYTLLLKGPLRFNQLKSMLGISSRTLSAKLKALLEKGYIRRDISPGPPVVVLYSLTEPGKKISLLSLPLIYQIAKQEEQP